MALPNSPFAGTNKGPAPQVARPAKGAQLGVSSLRRVIGNNIGSGYHLPFGAGYLKTNLISRDGITTAVHQYIYQGKTVSVSIPVKTVMRRGAIVTPIKLAPQKVDGF